MIGPMPREVPRRLRRLRDDVRQLQRDCQHETGDFEYCTNRHRTIEGAGDLLLCLDALIVECEQKYHDNES